MYLPRTHLRRTTHALRMVIALSTLACLGLSAPGCDAAGTAAEAWPAEPRARAQPLFIGGAWSVEGDKNWSAAHWNPATRVLYVGRDRGAIRSYSESGADAFALRSVHELDADIEGITQAWGDDDHVYAVLESEQSIVRYDLSSTVAQEIEAWDLSGLLPETDGFEGIAFVPDAALAAGGFVDRSGAVRPASLTGRDGLFFLCTQYGGDIRALDLGAAGAFEVVGVYGAPLASTRGLEWDPTGALLYLIEGGRSARVSLGSTADGARRVLDVVDVYDGPGPAGAEGLAIAHDATTAWAIVTDDDNKAKDGAILWYRDFQP